jgi:hypothetical protein
MKFFPTFSTILKSALNSEFFDTRKMQKIKTKYLGRICTFRNLEAERVQSTKVKIANFAMPLFHVLKGQ